MIINSKNIPNRMAKDVIPVKDRLSRMQQDNYRSLPKKECEKTVEQEISEFKDMELIKPVAIKGANPEPVQFREITAEETVKLNEGDMLKIEEKEAITAIEMKLFKIESIKAEMMKSGKFMESMYEIKKTETELLPLLYEAKARRIEMSQAIKSRIANAAPKAAILF